MTPAAVGGDAADKYGEGGRIMAGHNNGVRLRVGLAAAAFAAALLAAAWGGSPAGAVPAPRSGVATSGYLYWSNATTSDPGNGTIGRGELNGTDLNQNFITGASVPGVVLVFGGYLYWTNLAPLQDGAGTIGRARLNGTDVDQNFIAVPDGPSGVSALAVNARYLYWTNETAGTIGRANLDGTDVNQNFITGAAFPQTGLAIDSRYIYWINETAGTIGRANLDGTDVDQNFIAVPNAGILLGVAVAPGR
jgi:virginiamycin B lyase